MALTITVIRRPSMPAGHCVIADITFDNSYPTGGESLTPANLGLSTIDSCVARQKAAASRIVEYDYANSKLMLFTALGTEAADTSNQSTIVVRAIAFGDNATAPSA